MDEVEIYRSVYAEFKSLCAQGRQPSSFFAFCRDHGVKESKMTSVLKEEYQDVTTLPGYARISEIYLRIYEDFKRLCAEGNQPCTFTDYCKERGVSYARIHFYLSDHKLRLLGEPGFKIIGGSKIREIPFEDVIFEESHFFQAGNSKAIVVSVDEHVVVSFPADTDVAVVAKFVKKMRKEDCVCGDWNLE